jgi:hypothetical protein
MGKTYKDNREYKGTPIKKDKPRRDKRAEEDLYFYLGNTETPKRKK